MERFLRQVPLVVSGVFLAVFAAFSLPGHALAQEHIPLYEVTITPERDGSLSITEFISYDFARNWRHGITRDIPTAHEQESSAFYKSRYIAIEDLTTEMDGAPIPFTAEEDGDSLFIKVGDPYKTVTTEHSYTLTYVAAGALHYFDASPPELYWDAIGDQTPVEVAKAVVIINDEHQLLSGVGSCYVGTAGSQTPCGEPTTATGTYRYELTNLAPYHGVTVAYAYKEAAVPIVVREQLKIWLVAIPGFLVIVLAFAAVMYRFKTAFRTGRTIIAQYEPYEHFKPMYTGMLFDDRLDPQDITACIIYLAEQGYIKIKRTEAKVLYFFEVTDYELSLMRSPDAALSRFQRDVLDLLFEQPAAGATTSLSALKNNQSKQRENQKLLTRMRADLKKDLIDQGFFQRISFEELRPYVIGGALVAAVSWLFFVPLSILAVALVVLAVVFARRRTRKGYEALDHLKGFRMFLSVTEAERYTFHNAPEKSPEQFMEFLPYAVAFGVEQAWAEVFKDVTIPEPTWYESTTPGSFSATNLTSSVGAFSTAFASSSGSSGSTGGGSVGGGGGGGSVGSW